mgnify:CR=1 FL=1
MNLSDIPELCEWTHRRACSPGQTLVFEGEQPRTIYQVARGVIKLTRCSTGGREIIVGLVCPGEYLDVVAILDGSPHGVTASALAGSDVEVVAVSRDLALGSTELLQFLEKAALQELRAQRDWTVAMALERVETRAMRALTMLGERLGERREKGFELPLMLNRQEFAELIGTTTETAIRVLSMFRRRGITLERGGWLNVLQPDTSLA